MALTWHSSTYIAGKHYVEGECLSTDNKPTGEPICNGSKLMEMDTGKLYLYDEENGEWRAWT